MIWNLADSSALLRPSTDWSLSDNLGRSLAGSRRSHAANSDPLLTQEAFCAPSFSDISLCMKL